MKKKLLPIIIVVLAVLAIVGLGGTAVLYLKYRALGKEKLAASKDIKDFTNTVGNVLLLPSDEEPVVATVSDKTKLGQQLFFKSAENGDKVFFYTRAGKAILFRPSLKKVIEIASIQTNDVQATPQASSVPVTAPLTLTLANGTTTVGLTKSFEKKITDAIPTISVSDKISAKSTSYTETVIVDVKNSKDPRIQSLATLLKATIVPLPAGEAVPSSDILVIVGAQAK